MAEDESLSKQDMLEQNLKRKRFKAKEINKDELTVVQHHGQHLT